MIAKLKTRTAARLRALAAKLDPPTQPYGEWDAKQGALVIRTPGGLPLASVDISPGQYGDHP